MNNTGSKQPALSDYWRGERPGPVCAIVTGQVGLDKKPFVEEVVRLARERGA